MAYHSVSSQGPETVPNYLSAKSPRRLRALMRRNNLRYKGFVRYFDFQYVAKDDSWYVWFYPDMSKLTREERAEDLENV